MKSIIQKNKICFITGDIYNLHKHHIFGGANRNLSEKDGLYVYLRADYHNMSDKGVHHNRQLDLKLKKIAQKKWQEFYNKTSEDFIKRYGKNYL